MSITLNSHPEYRYVRAWGQMMGSFDNYIDEQVDKAIADNAPERAIYHDPDRDEWVTIDEKPIVTRTYVEQIAQEM